MRLLPPFDGKKIEANDLRRIEVSVPAQELYAEFKAASKEWLKKKKDKEVEGPKKQKADAAAAVASSSNTTTIKETTKKEGRVFKRHKRGHTDMAGGN